VLTYTHKHFSAKQPLIIGLFCGKWPMKIRHPMPLRRLMVYHNSLIRNASVIHTCDMTRCRWDKEGSVTLRWHTLCVCDTSVIHICDMTRCRYDKERSVTCVAVWCSVLQCVAVCCSVLQCVAVSRSPLYRCRYDKERSVTFLDNHDTAGDLNDRFGCVCVCVSV